MTMRKMSYDPLIVSFKVRILCPSLRSTLAQLAVRPRRWTDKEETLLVDLSYFEFAPKNSHPWLINGLKMAREFKAGDKVTCVVEQQLPNCLIVRFQSGKGKNKARTFRGVLIDEKCSATKR